MTNNVVYVRADYSHNGGRFLARSPGPSGRSTWGSTWAAPGDNSQTWGGNSMAYTSLKWRPMLRQMRESMLRQTLHLRIAIDTKKIQSSDWPKWRCALWPYVISQLCLDQMAFQMVWQMGCRYVNCVIHLNCYHSFCAGNNLWCKEQIVVVLKKLMGKCKQLCSTLFLQKCTSQAYKTIVNPFIYDNT